MSKQTKLEPKNGDSLIKTPQGVVILDENRLIKYLNEAACKLLDRKENTMIGQPFMFSVQPGDSIFLDLGPYTGKETKIRLRAAEIEWENDHSLLVTLTPPDDSEPQFSDSSANINTLLKILRDYFFVIDSTNRVIHVNDRARTKLEYPQNELIGLRFFELFPRRKWEEIKAAIEGVDEYHPAHFKVPLFTRSGSQIAVDGQITAGQWNGEDVKFACCRDISEEQRLELALRHSQDQLQLAMYSDSEFLWSLETNDSGNLNIIFVSPSIEKVSGFLPDEFVSGKRTLQSIVHQEDKPVVNDVMERRIVEGLRDHIEYRIVLPDGRIRWVRDSLKSRRIVDSRIRLDGIVSDITDRKRADEILQQTNEQLRLWVNELKQRNSEVTLLNEMGDLLQSCLNPKNVYQVMKQFAVELFPKMSGALYNLDSNLNLLEQVTSWGEHPPEETVFAIDDCWGMRRNQVQIITDPKKQINCDHFPVSEEKIPYICVPMTAQTETLGMLHMRGEFEHGTEQLNQLTLMMAGRVALALSNIRLSETLRKQSIRDPLTGLFNRRYLEEMMGRELRRANRYQRPIGVMILDVDHFKGFNDRYGHGAGDAVLRDLGSYLRNQIRGEDIVCRYGGEEFVIILAEANFEDTYMRAEEICADIAELDFLYGEQDLGHITVSIGVSSFPAYGKTVTQLINAADRAMYHAKKNGRNRVEKAEIPE